MCDERERQLSAERPINPAFSRNPKPPSLAGAEAIITFNLKDFPEEELSKYEMTALHPDEFIVNLIEINIGAVIEAARRHRKSLKNSPFTASEYIDLLLRQNLPATVSKIKTYQVSI